MEHGTITDSLSAEIKSHGWTFYDPVKANRIKKWIRVLSLT